MTDLLRLLNPTTRLEGESDALAAGRAGALGAFLLAVGGVIGAVIVVLTADSYAAQLRTAALAMHGDPKAAQKTAALMTPTLVYASAIYSVVCALVLVVLGAVQRRKPNTIIPLILGLLTAYSVLMFVIGKLPGAMSIHMELPVWRQVLIQTANVAALVFFYAGFRGANRLAKLRKATI